MNYQKNFNKIVYDEIKIDNEHDSISSSDESSASDELNQESKWNHTSTGGTILNDPMFKSDFYVDYRIWSLYSKKNASKSSGKNSNQSHKNSMNLLGSKMAKDRSDWQLKTLSTFNKGRLINNQNETQRLVDSSSGHLFDDSSQDELESLNKSSTGVPCNLNLYKGIIYSCLSSIFFSLSAVIVKYLNNIHPSELAVFRFIGIFILTIPLIVYNNLNPFGPPELRHLLIFRGIAGATSLFLRFFAFRYLPIVDASVIIFSVPVFVSIFAWLFLKEPCGLFQTFTITIAMIGLMMTTKLPFLFGPDDALVKSNNYYFYQQIPNNHSHSANYFLNITSPLISQSNTQNVFHLYGVLSALSSLIFASAVFIFIRKAKGAHHAVIMFNFGWVAIIETTVLTTTLNGFSLPRSQFEWYLIVILSVFSFCGQILLTRSLQLEQAGPVSVVRATTDIILAFLWQIIIFKETPDTWSICGALLVSSCIILTSLRKWAFSLPEHSTLKSKLYFLML